MKFKVGDFVQVSRHSQFYEEQAYDTFKRRRVFVITKIDEFNDIICNCFFDSYTNSYGEEDLIPYNPIKYKRKKLNL